MSAPLPGRIDLDQLRRQAKELRDAARLGEAPAAARVARHLTPRPPESINLAVAQLVIARENGFPSWPRLKAAVEATGGDTSRLARTLLAASIEGRVRLAARIVEATPSIARHGLFTAAVLGDASRTAELLAEDPSRALELDDDRGWPPLLYVSYSHWHRIDPTRAAGLAETARLLLDAGASPDANNGGRPGFDYRSALHGAARTNQTAVVRLLLERGALADDRFSLGEAVEWPDHESLRLLLDHGAMLHRTWSLEAAVGAGDAVAVTMLLEAAARVEPASRVADRAGSALIEAVSGDVSVVEALLAFGADPAARHEESLVRHAVRVGNHPVAALLADHGGRDDAGDADRLIGACARVDRAEANRILAAHPGLFNEMSEMDRAAVVDLAQWKGADAVAMSLDLGFPVNARGENGETALHQAAYEGRPDTVRLLIERGAEIDALDSRFDGTPLAFATVGSGGRPASAGDWVETVRLLLDAGASPEGVWLSLPKEPSEEVAALLRARGVPSPESVEETMAAEEPVPAWAQPGVLGEIGEQVRTAYETADMDLFASLLHPQVRWGGGGSDGCTDREQVLSWYRNLDDRGARASVTGVEVHPGSVLVGLVWGQPAIDVRQSPDQARYQVLRVEDGQIVEIIGHPDLAGARATAAGSDGS
ncbi:MAG TPA: ankyrin repeat domain-containing protein [Candidatus Dormibacteraeota bacterium]|jgi:ankyrin repeat protein|nr:ankyrin repeat domain-containing protein [Candidatus Dormibacteraeota bacterium]